MSIVVSLRLFIIKIISTYCRSGNVYNMLCMDFRRGTPLWLLNEDLHMLSNSLYTL